VQVDPMKPKLKPFGTERLKLNRDLPISSFAFKFTLRRYNKVIDMAMEAHKNDLVLDPTLDDIVNADVWARAHVAGASTCPAVSST